MYLDRRALLHHPDNALIFIAPEPTEYGIVYEVRVEDIVEMIGTEQQKAKLDRSYRMSRVYIKRNAVVVRQQWMLAIELPDDIQVLVRGAATLATEKSSAALVDRVTRRSLFSPSAVAKESPNGKPDPSPPTPEPHEPSGGGGGSSGVRG